MDDKFPISEAKRNHLIVELLIMNHSQMKVIEALQLMVLSKAVPEAAPSAMQVIRDMHRDNQKQIREWIYEKYGPDLGTIDPPDNKP